MNFHAELTFFFHTMMLRGAERMADTRRKTLQQRIQIADFTSWCCEVTVWPCWLTLKRCKRSNATLRSSSLRSTRRQLGKKIARVSTSCWFTNLEVEKHKQDINLYKKYTPEEYPKYDNYDAINVNKYTDIPYDYTGYIGVPITFIDKYNPEQFEIIKFRKGDDNKDLSINGKYPYFRILIKNKK